MTALLLSSAAVLAVSRELYSWKSVLYEVRQVCGHHGCGCVQVRLGLPATQWITVYNAHRPMKQRYHYNVANVRVEQHVVKGNDDGLYISSVACCQVRATCCVT